MSVNKKNSSLDVSNYRPVSILSVVSKILERCVYNQLLEFLQENNMLYELQSGFRGKHSTDTCLIHLFDFIRNNNSKGLYTGMVLLDLQKAFDTVDHNILCQKLEVMGVDVQWFLSYLGGRSQVVGYDGVLSDSKTVTCGVPQGSILGPLLFLCYVNDMKISIDNDCKLILYADDSAILFAHHDPDFIARKLGVVLESCSDWLIDNKLSLHLGKTECLLFGPRRKLRNIEDFVIKCHDHLIKSSFSVKYLGVQIDRFLSCDSIVQNIIHKVNARLKFLYRNAGWLNTRSRLTLATALIQCYFDYASSSWYSSLTKTLQKKLQVMQNKVVRFVLDLGPRSRISCDQLDVVNMLNVSDRTSQLRLNHVFNVIHGCAPTYLKEHFTLNNNVTRGGHNMNFQLPSVNSHTKSSFYFNAIKDWNMLPLEVKEHRNRNSFKDAVKAHLTERARSRELDEFLHDF